MAMSRQAAASRGSWTASEMTYIVSSGALNSTHSLTRTAGDGGGFAMNNWRRGGL